MSKEIEVKVKVDTSQAVSSVQALSSGMNNAQTSVKGLKNETDKVSSGGIDKLGGSLSSLSPAFKNGISGAKSLGTQLLLLAANPIGAVILAVVGAATLLFKAFTSTKEGTEKLEQVMAGLSATVDVVRDRILNVGTSIVKFFKGDFKGAIAEGKKAINGFGAEVEREFKQAAEATKFLQQVTDATRDLSVSRAKLNRDLAKSKEIITDENASYAQKKKAIDEVRIAEEKQTEKELENARKKVAAVSVLNGLSDSKEQALQRRSAAEIELFALEKESSDNKRAIRKTELRALNEENARVKEIADKRKAEIEASQVAAKVAYDAQKVLLEESLKDESLNFEQRRKLVSDNVKLNAADRKKLNAEINKDEQKSIDEHNKVIDDLNKRYDEERENRLADTAVKKEELDYERKVKEIENLTTNELERQTLIEKLDLEHKDRLGIATKTDNQNKIDEAKIQADKEIEIERQIAEQKKLLQDTQLNAISAGINLLSGLAGKNKTLQKAAIIAESAMGIARSIISNTASNVAVAAQGAALAIPSGGTSVPIAAKIIVANNISTGIGIAGNIAATGKALAAVGSGGAPSPGNIPNIGGGTRVSLPNEVQPNPNVVGASQTNQIAQTMALQGQRPIKAFVVANDVTTQQGLDRSIISSATLG